MSINSSEMLLLIAGSIFNMADEAANFEPDSKRPRIALEPSQSNLQTEANDQASEEKTYELPKCVQGKDTNGKERKDSTDPDHVRNESPKTRNIRDEDNPRNDASVNEWSKSGLDAVIDTCVSEKDVGILEFVGNFPGFHGVLKQRYTDFIVGERDLQGNIVRLSDTSIPQGNKTKEFDLDILSLEEREKIQKVVDDEEKNLSVTLSPDDDKDHRRLVHRAIRENYSFLGKEDFIMCYVESWYVSKSSNVPFYQRSLKHSSPSGCHALVNCNPDP